MSNKVRAQISVWQFILTAPVWIPILFLGGVTGFLWAVFRDGFRQGQYYGETEFYTGAELEQSHGKNLSNHPRS